MSTEQAKTAEQAKLNSLLSQAQTDNEKLESENAELKKELADTACDKVINITALAPENQSKVEILLAILLIQSTYVPLVSANQGAS